MSIPSKADAYSQLVEYLRKAQEASAMLSHLNAAEGDDKGKLIAKGWMVISEALKLMIGQVIRLATKGVLQ